jgi:RNase H-like domain found in reverse transcriptase
VKSAGVTLKLGKCMFAAPEVPYLGYIVGQEGINVDSTKISSFLAASTPRTKTRIRIFLGMCGVYSRFIPHYSHISYALTKYMKDDVTEPFQLDTAGMEAHNYLKIRITSARILALPRAAGLFVIEADASASASQLGVQLLQEQLENSFRPIGYWSRQCSSAECNYIPNEREALVESGCVTLQSLVLSLSIICKDLWKILHDIKTSVSTDINTSVLTEWNYERNSYKPYVTTREIPRITHHV